MIVNAGKVKLANIMIGNFNKIDIGDGGDDTSTSQTSLDHSVLTSKKDCTPTLVGNTVIYEVTFTGSELNSNVISEIGVFNSDGVMLSRVNFNSIGPLASNETVSFTLRLEVV